MNYNRLIIIDTHVVFERLAIITVVLKLTVDFYWHLSLPMTTYSVITTVYNITHASLLGQNPETYPLLCARALEFRSGSIERGEGEMRKREKEVITRGCF